MLCGISSLSYRALWSFPFIVTCPQHTATTSDVGAYGTFPIPASILFCFVLWLFVLLLFDVGISVFLAFVSHILGCLVFI